MQVKCERPGSYKVRSHIQNTMLSHLKKKMGWITRTFRTRDVKPVIILLRLLVVSRLEYCCVLMASFKAGEIAAMDNVLNLCNLYKLS